MRYALVWRGQKSICLLCLQYIHIQTPVAALAFYNIILHIFVTKIAYMHNTHNDIPISIIMNETMISSVMVCNCSCVVSQESEVI